MPRCARAHLVSVRALSFGAGFQERQRTGAVQDAWRAHRPPSARSVLDCACPLALFPLAVAVPGCARCASRESFLLAKTARPGQPAPWKLSHPREARLRASLPWIADTKPTANQGASCDQEFPPPTRRPGAARGIVSADRHGNQARTRSGHSATRGRWSRASSGPSATRGRSSRAKSGLSATRGRWPSDSSESSDTFCKQRIYSH